MYGVNYVRHTEIRMTEIQVTEPSAGSSTNRPDICKLINSICNEEKLPEEWKQSITVPIYKKGDKSL